jgi:hypothetical protein
MCFKFGHIGCCDSSRGMHAGNTLKTQTIQ